MSQAKRIKAVEDSMRVMRKRINRLYAVMALIGVCWFVVLAAFIATTF